MSFSNVRTDKPDDGFPAREDVSDVGTSTDLSAQLSSGVVLPALRSHRFWGRGEHQYLIEWFL